MSRFETKLIVPGHDGRREDRSRSGRVRRPGWVRPALTGVLLGALIVVAGAFLAGRLGSIATAAPTAGGVGVQDSVYDVLDVFNGALMLIRNQYLEPVDGDTLMDGAVRGIFDALDDDSSYLNAEEADRYRNAGGVEAAIGIGLRKRYYLHADDVLPDSPAAEAGIERGDAITEIDGHNTRDLRIPVARLLLSGPPGSTVELTIRGDGDAEGDRVVLERTLLPLPPVEQELLDEGIGMVRIRRFHDETPAQLATAVASLQESGATELILDLRGSRGAKRAPAAGAGCESGAEAAAVFMDGEVVELVTRTAEGEQRTAPLATDSVEASFEGPLAAIINTSTVCPGEVMAAALAARDGADVVGRRTAGRTGRPQLIELPEGDAVLLSTAHIRAVDGEDILGVGVSPTVTPDDLGVEFADLDEDDPELDLALRALEHRREAADDPA